MADEPRSEICRPPAHIPQQEPSDVRLSRSKCSLSAMDPHWQCSRGHAEHMQPIGLVTRAMQNVSIIFVGDSMSLQMWMAALLVFHSSIPAGESYLRCPDLSHSYCNTWETRHLRCAKLPAYGSRVCFVKAAVTDRWSVAYGSNQTLSHALYELGTRQQISSRDVLVLNAGVHYGMALPAEVLLPAGHVLAHLRTRGIAPRVLWRETGPCGCSPSSVMRLGVVDDRLVAARLGLRAPLDILRAYDVAMALGAPLRWQGHVGNSTNRDGESVEDCSHYCLDGSNGVLREWVLLLLHAIEWTSSTSSATAARRPAPPPPSRAGTVYRHVGDGWCFSKETGSFYDEANMKFQSLSVEQCQAYCTTLVDCVGVQHSSSNSHWPCHPRCCILWFNDERATAPPAVHGGDMWRVSNSDKRTGRGTPTGVKGGEQSGNECFAKLIS